MVTGQPMAIGGGWKALGGSGGWAGGVGGRGLLISPLPVSGPPGVADEPFICQIIFQSRRVFSPEPHFALCRAC